MLFISKLIKNNNQKKKKPYNLHIFTWATTYIFSTAIKTFKNLYERNENKIDFLLSIILQFILQVSHNKLDFVHHHKG